MKVKCTAPWWERKMYHKAGEIVEVPDGTPIPRGFMILDAPVVSHPPRKASNFETEGKNVSVPDEKKNSWKYGKEED